MVKFIRRHAIGSLEHLNLRQSVLAEPCRHCACRSAMISRGFLKGIAASGRDRDTRGLRFLLPTATRIRAAGGLSRRMGST